MVNAMRGEVAILLRNKSYTMRPTFEALGKIEHDTKLGIIALARQLHEGSISLHSMAVIITYCINAVEKAVTLESVGEALVEQGISTAIKPVSELLAGVLGGYANA